MGHALFAWRLQEDIRGLNQILTIFFSKLSARLSLLLGDADKGERSRVAEVKPLGSRTVLRAPGAEIPSGDSPTHQLRDYYGYAEGYFETREHLKAGVGHLYAGVVSVRAIAQEYVDLCRLLQSDQIVAGGTDLSPKCIDVVLERMCLGDVRLEQPRVFSKGGAGRGLTLALAAARRGLGSDFPGDLLQVQIPTGDPQCC